MISTVAAGTAASWMEDDFHCFGVTIQHESGRITNVAARVERAPWSTCPHAAGELAALIGRRLFARDSDVGARLPMRRNCTHLFDLAGLAVAAASRGTRHRTYEATVSDRVPKPPGRQPHVGRCTAELARDGVPILRWRIEDEAIVDPRPGRSLLGGFRAWTETLDEAAAEAAGVLRRAVDVSGGRSEPLDGVGFASEMGLPALCYSYQPSVAPHARRMQGTTRDFSAGPNGMLVGRDVWEGGRWL